jgi:hypothetical protein
VILASRIPIDRIELGAVIRRSGFSEVYRGRYRDQDVAVKMQIHSDLYCVTEFVAGGDLRSLLRSYEGLPSQRCAAGHGRQEDADRIRAARAAVAPVHQLPKTLSMKYTQDMYYVLSAWCG